MIRSEIIYFLKVHSEVLRQDYGVRDIALFGSHALENATDDSDIDIAVELIETRKTLTNFFALQRYNRLEQLGWLPSVQDWLELRQIRNEFTHDYPDTPPERQAILST